MSFKFFKPKSVKEASELLKNANYIAVVGGTDVVVKVRGGFYKTVEALVDLNGIFSNEIKIDKDYCVIGSACVMNTIADSDIIKENFPALSQAAASIAAFQIRNAATIGGNVANSSPVGDTIPALYSLDAVVNIVSAESSRNVPIEDFITGVGRNVLQPGEMIASFSIPMRKTVGSFTKIGERKALSISKVNLALSSWNDGKPHYRVAMGAVAIKVLRCPKAEEYLEKAAHPLTDETIQKAAEFACETAAPITDLRSTKAYRKQMAGVLLKRALESIR